jgi:rhodanese-related sulfurtransferase
VFAISPRTARVQCIDLESIGAVGLGIEGEASMAGDPQELSCADVAQRLERGEPLLLLDVREGWEREIAVIPDSYHIPMGEVPNRLHEIPADQTVVVQCHHGGRSMQVARLLVSKGYTQVYNLAGGIDAWSRDVDDSLPTY